jgi:hypothetical protein
MFWIKALAVGRSGKIVRRKRLAHRARATVVSGMATLAKPAATRAANMKAMSPWREMRFHEETRLRPRIFISMPSTISGF